MEPNLNFEYDISHLELEGIGVFNPLPVEEDDDEFWILGPHTSECNCPDCNPPSF